MNLKISREAFLKKLANRNMLRLWCRQYLVGRELLRVRITKYVIGSDTVIRICKFKREFRKNVAKKLSLSNELYSLGVDNILCILFTRVNFIYK